MTDVEVWRTASTLNELGDLTARWMLEEIDYDPMHGGPLEDETSPMMVHVLTRLNRLGFVTNCSQPGTPDREQRAMVTGRADAAIAGLICGILQQTELVVIAFPPHSPESHGQVVVTVDDGDEHGWVGRDCTEVGGWASDGSSLSVAMEQALADAWGLHIFDPVWGRDSRLWDALGVVADAAVTSP